MIETRFSVSLKKKHKKNIFMKRKFAEKHQHLFHAHFTSGYGEIFANIFLFFMKAKYSQLSSFTIRVMKIHDIIFSSTAKMLKRHFLFQNF